MKNEYWRRLGNKNKYGLILYFARLALYLPQLIGTKVKLVFYFMP